MKAIDLPAGPTRIGIPTKCNSPATPGTHVNLGMPMSNSSNDFLIQLLHVIGFVFLQVRQRI